MKTALDLLDTAPDGQVKRMQIVFKSIAAGEWADAELSLSNAARETEGQFSADCIELALFCNDRGIAS